MGFMPGTRAALAFAAALAWAAPAAAGDFMDTRLTWVFGDDDILKNAGEVLPDSPKPGMGDRKGYEMFMDGLNSKTKGRENLTHIALYKKMDGFLKGVTTEAGLVLKLDLNALMSGNSQLKVSDVLVDDGTYLRLQWSWREDQPARYNIAATFFPFDTERFRLGYLWDISWGGGGIFTSRRAGPAPGFKLETNCGPVNAYVGLKTALVSQVVQLGTGDVEEITVRETNYGVLGGAGVDATDWLRIDLGAGWFQQGTFNFEGLVGAAVYSVGLSGRLTFHRGIPIQSSIDYMLYRNDPDVNVVGWWRERYEPGKFSWSVSAEFNWLWQRLKANELFGTTRMQPAYAGAVQGKIKWGYLRAQVVGLIRNLEYILQNVPSLTPFVALPEEGVEVKPEYFVAATIDYYFDGVHLMPFITGGVQIPATYASGSGDDRNVQVVRDATRRDRLPAGYDADPVIQGRVGVQWDLSEFFSLLGNIQFVRDTNLTRLGIVQTGDRREFQRPNQVGFTVMTRARF